MLEWETMAAGSMVTASWESDDFDFYSTVAERTYRIFVTLPASYSSEAASPGGYRVVYLLDGNWHSVLASEVARLANFGGDLDELIIVAIGYPIDDDMQIMAERAWDYLPEPMGGGGGAPDFLAFIEQELVPYIDDNYNTTAKGRTLAGHSYGGFFTYYALFHNQEDLFDAYMVLSPALWYADKLAFSYEEAYAADNKKLPVDLYFSVGENEPERMSQLFMVSNLVELYEIMAARHYGKLDMELVIFDGVGHASSVPGALSGGMIATAN
jgi:predicted alpha/beta superfamily hydrolase